jgi:Peptidase family C25
MPTKIDKVIVTNFAALTRKYGDKGLEKINYAVSDLIAADENRGLISRYIGLDDQAEMKKLKARAVKKASDYKQNKAAIDGVYKALAPDYILILGAIDVIPHQNMKNPMYSPDPDGDPDRLAFGDLPYACERSYSQRPENFIGPTRVVGRIPDVTGSDDPSYLMGLLQTAIHYKATTGEAYQPYFGISAEVWQSATKQSLERIFGDAGSMNIVPPKTDSWTRALIGRKMLFVNCHGNSNTPFFSGQSVMDPDDYPDALRAKFVDGKIAEGTLAAIECCYGGQLYNPRFARGQQGMCNTYMRNKAYGYFASTTIAYGPSSGNGQADLICQYFLRSVLAGASIGRAALEARQKFARTTSMGNPMNIKTLAQFNLYGDPSCSPVKMIDLSAGPAPKTPAKGVSPSVVDRVDRASRRRSLFIEGCSISETRATSRESKKPPSKSIATALKTKAKELGVTASTTKSFVVEAPKKIKGMPKSMIDDELIPSGYHVVLGRDKIEAKISKSKSKGKPKSPAPFTKIVALVAKEVDGEVISVTKLFSK